MVIKNIVTKEFDERVFVYGALALFLLALSIFMFKYSKALFFILLFIALNSIMGLYKAFFYIPIEIELISLGTILCTLSFGLKEGLTVGVIGSLLAAVVNGTISYLTIPMVVGYCFMAFITPVFSGVGAMAGGITIVLITNVLIFIVYQFMGYDLFSNFTFSISNIVWNLLLFLRVAPFLFSIMK